MAVWGRDPVLGEQGRYRLALAKIAGNIAHPNTPLAQYYRVCGRDVMGNDNAPVQVGVFFRVRNSSAEQESEDVLCCEGPPSGGSGRAERRGKSRSPGR